MSDKLSHTNEQGKARMVDVGQKPIQRRSATASGFISLQEATMQLIRENLMKKGDVLTIAEIAGIQAAKQTSTLIPLCHPLPITKVDLQARLCNSEPDHRGIEVVATVQCNGQTGVEMEALTGVSVALLTIYDMCKAVDKQMVISHILLNEKTKS